MSVSDEGEMEEGSYEDLSCHMLGGATRADL
jgi:hypothetical protein